MKKLLFIAIAAIAFTTATQAQDSTMNGAHMKHDFGAKQHRPNMMNELNLTPDQQQKMKQMRDDNRSKMEAIKSNTSLSDDQKKEQLKALHEEEHKNMESVLTDDQKAKMKQLKQQEKQQRKAMKAGADSTEQQ